MEGHMAINTGKVITGGLLAGLVFTVFDLIFNSTLLASDNMALVNRLSLDPALTTDFSYAIPWIVIDFILGFVVVWNYAATRPRFGPGPKTAVLAGLVPYVAVSVVLLGFTTMGIFTMSMWVKNTVLVAITVIAGSVAGAWAYKEA
jgi:hypothetical protein